jgi:hypothetical protein
MTDLRKAAEQAIEAIMHGGAKEQAAAVYELRQALAQPKREWVGLTRDEVLDIEEETTHPLAFYDAIEAKLKEKNT